MVPTTKSECLEPYWAKASSKWVLATM
jgi:hypothetical protein